MILLVGHFKLMPVPGFSLLRYAFYSFTPLMRWSERGVVCNSTNTWENVFCVT